MLGRCFRISSLRSVPTDAIKVAVVIDMLPRFPVCADTLQKSNRDLAEIDVSQ